MKNRGKEMRKKDKEKKQFKKFLKIYIILLIILMIAFLVYVVNSLMKYEQLQVDRYLSDQFKKIAASAEKGKVPEYFDISGLTFNQFEQNNLTTEKALGKVLKENELTFKLNNDSIDLTNPVYDVFINGNSMFMVQLNGEKKLTRLGILTFQDWELKNITLKETKGSVNYTIEAPNDSIVLVNGVNLKDAGVEPEAPEGLKELTQYLEFPYSVTYKIDQFIGKPDITIEDQEHHKLEYQQSETTYRVTLNNIEKIADYETARKKIKGDLNIEEIAKNWSLYLTNDLKGNLHGFHTISKYLIKDSYMWKYAYKWATDVDITFITSHVLDNPVFTNQKISNFEFYNENAFSCEVYLEKNLILNKLRGKKLQDVMNERMYFAYIDGEWKLVNMQSVINTTE